jgi:hypothetical protein
VQRKHKPKKKINSMNRKNRGKEEGNDMERTQGGLNKLALTMGGSFESEADKPLFLWL